MVAVATGHWPRWLHLAVWGESKQAAQGYTWCLGKSRAVLQLDYQRGAGTLAQPGPWLPSQQDLGGSGEKSCCSPW